MSKGDRDSSSSSALVTLESFLDKQEPSVVIISCGSEEVRSSAGNDPNNAEAVYDSFIESITKVSAAKELSTPSNSPPQNQTNISNLISVFREHFRA